MPVFKIIGGHGRVALLLARELAHNPSNQVVSLLRDPGQFAEVRATGAEPQLFDIESATIHEFVTALRGADFVIWSAGAGGKGGSQRTYAIDRDKAIISMQASRQVVGISRYVMVSYLGSSQAPELDPNHLLYHYGQAKHEADEYLKELSGLNYTIVNPGTLNNSEATGLVDFHPNPSEVEGRSISRHNVAKIIATILTDDQAFNRTLHREIKCLDGNERILEGLRSL